MIIFIITFIMAVLTLIEVLRIEARSIPITYALGIYTPHLYTQNVDFIVVDRF